MSDTLTKGHPLRTQLFGREHRHTLVDIDLVCAYNGGSDRFNHVRHKIVMHVAHFSEIASDVAEESAVRVWRHLGLLDFINSFDEVRCVSRNDVVDNTVKNCFNHFRFVKCLEEKFGTLCLVECFIFN